MIVKKMNKKTQNKYTINQVTQCESEPQETKTTNIEATLYSQFRATPLTRYNFTATFSEKKYIFLKSQTETKIDSITNLSIKAIRKTFTS